MRTLRAVLVGGSLVVLLGLAPAVADAAALGAAPLPSAVTNGEVSAILPVGNRVYIGGTFTYVGPKTGAGVPLDRLHGRPAGRFPTVNRGGLYEYPGQEAVTAAVSDGAGGYFLGGSLTEVGGVPRAGLAHVRADGRVDQTWDPGPNGPVQSLARSGSILYVGGSFSRIAGVRRNGIAAVDARTGAATAWNPNPRDAFGRRGDVAAMALSGSTLYVSGGFARIGGRRRSGLAALDVQTGRATSWYPGDVSGAVYALAVSDSTVYAGGSIGYIGFQRRDNIAAIDARTGALTAWDPRADGVVRALAVSGSTVYAGGQFTRIGDRGRTWVAALDARTGIATSWNPHARDPLCPGPEENESDPHCPFWPGVYGLAISGATVYVGGQFVSIGGRQRDDLAALSARTASATAWNPGANGRVTALVVSRSRVYAGGAFTSAGGRARNRIAALDARTGAVTAWNPDADGRVRTLARLRSRVLAGGDFTSIGGRRRHFLAALRTRGGGATRWNPRPNGRVRALAVRGATVYAGGAFTRIGRRRRRFLAALDSARGAATRWRANTNGAVLTLAASWPRLYVGGVFHRIRHRRRGCVAAVSAITGAVTAWNPSADAPVETLAVSGRRVYAGGSFDHIGGRTRHSIAALDPRRGVAAAWNPNADDGKGGDVEALAASQSRVYAGGAFYTIGGRDRFSLAALHAATGAATGWRPDPHAEVFALAIAGSRVYVGGAFGFIRDEPQEGFAAFGPPHPPPPSQVPPALASPFPPGPHLLDVSRHRLRLTRLGTIRPRLTCLRTRHACRGILVAITGRARLSFRVGFVIAAGRTATVAVGLRRGQIDVLRRRGRLAARIVAVARNRTVGQAVVPVVAR